MRMMRRYTGWLLLGLLAVAGCQATKPTFRKPVFVEEYTVPPTDDSRFSSPVSYPKDTLNKGLTKPSSSDGNQPPGSPPSGSRFGGPSMGMGGAR